MTGNWLAMRVEAALGPVLDDLGEVTPLGVAQRWRSSSRRMASRSSLARRVRSRALACIIQCAVTRRHSSAGANPARQLSLQPVAVGADDGGNDIG